MFGFVQAGGNVGLALVFLLATGAATLMLPIRLQRRMPFLWRWGFDAGLWLDMKLNRNKRTQRARFFRGLVATVLIVLAGVSIGRLAHALGAMTYGWAALLILLVMAMHATLPYIVLAQSARVIRRGDKRLMRVLLGVFGRTAPEFSDLHALGRLSVELGAWLLNRLLVGPLFWFLLAGTEGLAVYVLIAALDQAVGIEDEQHRFFGWTAAKLDDALNFIPARLTALLIALAAVFVSKARPAQALAVMLAQARKYPALNSGWPLSAMAGAVGVTLAGPLAGTESGPARPWIGAEGSSAKVEIIDVARAKWLAGVCFLIVLMLVSLGFFLKSKQFS